jgi:hypothetical protein
MLLVLYNLLELASSRRAKRIIRVSYFLQRNVYVAYANVGYSIFSVRVSSNLDFAG